MIDITGVDLVKFAQKVYDLSAPAGLGWLHAQGGGLSEEDAAKCVQEEGHVALSMDYVHGRGCKMIVFREGGRLSIRDSWYDHTDAQLRELLSAFGLHVQAGAEHGVSCECRDCKAKRVGGTA